MRKLLLTLVSLFATVLAVPAQSVIYQDASAFPVYGKAYKDDGGSGPHFRRLPESLHGVVRDPVWGLGCNSAGLYVRFRSNAPRIDVHWTNNGNHMSHMADCGTGGLDLYVWQDGRWQFAGSAFDNGMDHTRTIVSGMEPQMREFMLYLSLYDEVKTLELGVPEDYVLEQPQMRSPDDRKPIVMYGTSILQGGCTSRPGTAFTNILSRRFNRTVINLGFSGNALLDEEIARLMAEVEDPAVFVLDYVPNSTPERTRERGEKFFRILRDSYPGVPVIFVENPLFTHGTVDRNAAKWVEDNNAEQKALYQRLKKAGEKRIYYVSAKGMIGDDGEAAVDGIHFTDLGMFRYADHITPVLKRALRDR